MYGVTRTRVNLIAVPSLPYRYSAVRLSVHTFVNRPRSPLHVYVNAPLMVRVSPLLPPSRACGIPVPLYPSATYMTEGCRQNVRRSLRQMAEGVLRGLVKNVVLWRNLRKQITALLHHAETINASRSPKSAAANRTASKTSPLLKDVPDCRCVKNLVERYFFSAG